MMRDFNYSNGYTHGGKFHSDDVISTCLLWNLCPTLEIHRGFSPPINDEHTIVYDIGNGEFDHHSTPRRTRSNGVPYSACSKIWEAYGENIIRNIYQDFSNKNISHIISKIDYQLQEIDTADNNGISSFISNIISSFNNPSYNEVENYDAFMKVCSLMSPMINELIKSSCDIVISGEEAKRYYDIAVREGHPKWVICDKECSIGILVNTKCLVSMCPSKRGGYSITSLTKRVRGKIFNKFLFPEELRGKSEEELNKIHHGMKFCHPSGFMASFTTYESALHAIMKWVNSAEFILTL